MIRPDDFSWTLGYLRALGDVTRAIEERGPLDHHQLLELLLDLHQAAPMPVKNDRDLVRTLPCPSCGAAPGEPCIYDVSRPQGRRSTEQGSNHIDRVRLAAFEAIHGEPAGLA